MAPRTVAIVPHTHWDREWYSPFQDFRMRLVKLLDALLPKYLNTRIYAALLDSAASESAARRRSPLS